ncbi:hypothetical protein [Christensenella minuta]|uniref:Uncharacterized protein n=1 Tax=Christensenella minuta TaxID=626937 RepID=A0A136Q3X1_9FIRM|nr:hypothetical protein [Christensenella minuta]KXK65226.1 hypothetical protein HMPREF3293_01815 [Christensenella minuta]
MLFGCGFFFFAKTAVSAVPELTGKHADTALIREAATGKIAGNRSSS